MLRKIGTVAKLVRVPADLGTVDRIILPGVGHFRSAMATLNESGLADGIRTAVAQRKPLLGICLGMQLIGKHSDEGDCAGLGIVDAHSVRFSCDVDEGLPVPHMGWREVTAVSASQILSELPETPRFYFVHSYHVVLARKSDALLEANYGGPFVAAYQTGHVIGVQFHPEKSHKFGEQLLRNFVAADAY
jgi:glutamine amidotransferase